MAGLLNSFFLKKRKRKLYLQTSYYIYKKINYIYNNEN